MNQPKKAPALAEVALAFLGAVVETPKAMLSPWVAGATTVWHELAGDSDAQVKARNRDEGSRELRHR